MWGSCGGHLPPPPPRLPNGVFGRSKFLFSIYSSTAHAADPGTFITPPIVHGPLPDGTKTRTGGGSHIS